MTQKWQVSDWKPFELTDFNVNLYPLDETSTKTVTPHDIAN